MRDHELKIAWIGLMVAVVGCGKTQADLPKLAPVVGVVTLDGKPLANAMISFVPRGATRGTGANGRTDKAGNYELSSKSGEKGAAFGEYRVVVNKFVMSDGSDFPLEQNSSIAPMNSGAKQILPTKYSMVEQTTLRANVGENANNINFALVSKP